CARHGSIYYYAMDYW
nr:immunoglobulin heavy chain junction region [Mus musculus]MBK4186703.1 immunoglobulin heavy chain junction region [Mus musculus]